MVEESVLVETQHYKSQKRKGKVLRVEFVNGLWYRIPKLGKREENMFLDITEIEKYLDDTLTRV